MDDMIFKMKSEADGFRYVYNKLNAILIDNFMEEESVKIAKEIDLVNPAITNGCFACEIYLKTILTKQRKEIKDSHNLRILFCSTNGTTQNEIINKFINIGYTKDLFKRKLRYIANGYTIARYDYENTETYYMLSGFIYNFIEILRETIKEME